MNNKIAFIVYFKDDRLLEEDTFYISKLNIPSDIEVEFFSCTDDDMYKAYNEAIDCTDAYYKVFLQENVFIVNNSFISDAIRDSNHIPNVKVFKTSYEKRYFLSKSYYFEEGNEEEANNISPMTSGCVMTIGNIRWNEDGSIRFIGDSDSANCESSNNLIGLFSQSYPWIMRIDEEIYKTDDYNKELYLELIRADQVSVNSNDIPFILEKCSTGEMQFDYFESLIHSILIEPDWALSFIKSSLNSNHEPLVSIVMSSYNHQKYIRRSIDSIMRQTYHNFELLITDDGSTDGTRDEIEKAIKYYDDPRISYYPNEKNTYFKNIVKTYKLAKGKYIATLSADDYYFDDKIEKQVQFLENCNDKYHSCFTWIRAFGSKELCLSYEKMFNVQNRSRGERLFNMLFGGNTICASSMMMKRTFFQELDYYDFSLRQFQDFETWIQLLFKENLYVLSEPLTHYGVVEGSLSDPSILGVHIRGAVEMEQVIYEAYSSMNNELFKEIFSINNNTLTSMDISCLKIKLLIDNANDNTVYYQVALRLFYDNRHTEGFCEILENKYGISIKMIHNIISTKTSTALSLFYKNEFDSMA